MALLVPHLVGIIVATLGWLSAIVSCGLPMWLVMKFQEHDTGQSFSIWKGLWQTCEVQELGRIQCMAHDYTIAFQGDLLVSQVLTVICIFGIGLGLLLCVAGHKCSNQMLTATYKRTMKVAGTVFIGFGLLLIVPTLKMTQSLLHDKNNLLLDSMQKVELGPSLYLAWVSWPLVFLGGFLLDINYPSTNGFARSPEEAEFIQLASNRPGYPENSHGTGYVAMEAGERRGLSP